jgi:uncharacterized membrane protein
MGLVGPILGLLFFAGVLGVLGIAAVWLVRQAGRGQTEMRSSHLGAEPLEIARRRLAAGEITIAEFEELRDRLQV